MNVDPDKVSIADVYKLLISVNKQNNDINNKLEKIEQHFTKELEDIKGETKLLLEENKKLKTQLNEVSKKQKKYNLIIHGIPEEKDDPFQAVRELVEYMLGIQLTINSIRDAYRIGKSGNDKPRPILLDLVSYQKKQEILKGAKKLKGSNIYINPDLTKEDLQDRKTLTDHLKLAREKHYSARIVKNSLLVNGELYNIRTLKENPLYMTSNSPTLTTTSAIPTHQSTSAPPTPNRNTATTGYEEVLEVVPNSSQKTSDKKKLKAEHKKGEGKDEEDTVSIAERLIKKRKESTKTCSKTNV